MVRVTADDANCVPSIAEIYQGAAWHEREAYDFFGIRFSGHPNLKPLILTREDKNLNPLLHRQERLKKREEVFGKKVKREA